MARNKTPKLHEPHLNPLVLELMIANEGRVLAAASAARARRYAELAAASGPAKPEATEP